MKLINSGLADLRSLAKVAMIATYDALLPSLKERTPDEIIGAVNILTPVDVKIPVTDEGDLRHGGVLEQFQRLRQERKPRRLILFKSKEDLKLLAPEVYKKGLPKNVTEELERLSPDASNTSGDKSD